MGTSPAGKIISCGLVQILYRKMDFLKRILQPGDCSPSASALLQAPHFNTNSSLPSGYYSLAFGTHPSKSDTIHNLTQVVRHFQTVTSTPAAIKTLTIVLAAVSSSKYDQDILQVLESVQIPKLDVIDELKTQWVWDLTISIKSYLIRLPSLGQVLRRAVPTHTESESSFTRWLSDLYLLINLLSLLFPYLTNAFNTFGRYYLKPGNYFTEFYRVVSEQLLDIYNNLRLIVTHFLRDYKSCPLEELKCFIKTLPQIEILCDKMEEALLNKYFRGKGPSPKIYFKEEEIAEITYYLKQSPTNIKHYSNEHENTAEEQFDQYQA